MNLIKRYPLASFFVFAFLITWTCQLTAIVLASRQGMALSNETNFLYVVDLFTLRLSLGQAAVVGLFILPAGPLLSAIFVTWLVDGKAGVRALWEQSTKWKIGVKWYLVVFALPLVISGISLGLGLPASNGQIDYTPKVPLVYFLPFFLYMLVFTGVAEEPGWRGFALPRLQQRHSAYRASWILGTMWGLWHVPFILYYNYAQGIAVVLVSFVILIIGGVGWAIVNTWLYNSTSSVWIIILLHGWGNIVQFYLVVSSNNLVAQALYGMVPWLIAIVVLWVYGRENLARHPRPQWHSVRPSRREPEPYVGMAEKQV